MNVIVNSIIKQRKRFKGMQLLCISLFLFSVCFIFSCTDDRDISSEGPSIVEALFSVKIKDPATRVVDPLSGYEGVVKKQFVNGDALLFTYYNGTQKESATATYNAEAWTTVPASIYLNTQDADVAVIATYQPEDTLRTAPAISVYSDHLIDTADLTDGIVVDGDKANVSFALRHSRTLIDVTGVCDTAGNDLADTKHKLVALTATILVDGNERVVDFFPEFKKSGNYQTIAPSGAELKKVSLRTASDQSFVIKTSIKLQEGMRHPLRIVVSPRGATIKESDITGWYNTENIYMIPEGYDYVIKTAADLRRLRDSVNRFERSDIFDTAASDYMRVLQVADIDLSEDQNWLPIGWGIGKEFRGIYNGNGYKIKNMRINRREYIGLFAYVRGSTIVNVHLRDVNVTTDDPDNSAGALIGRTASEDDVRPIVPTTIAFCSATGRVEGGIRV